MEPVELRPAETLFAHKQACCPCCAQDYKPPPYLIDRVHLTFVLGENSTQVLSRLSFKPNYEGDVPPPLPLDGAALDADLLFLKSPHVALLLSCVCAELHCVVLN